jgi:CheY-like chemotaxis protein
MSRILVVDDAPALRQMLATVLEAAGHVVLTAASGLEALQVIEQRRPDAVLLDLEMPVMTGWAFLDACRAAGHADLRIAVMSGLPQAAEATQRDYELAAALAKPFDLVELLDTVEQLLAAPRGGARRKVA